MQNLNVKVESLKYGTLTVLQGKALDPLPPMVLKIKGDIHSVSAFISGRKTADCGLQQILEGVSVVIVNVKEKSIRLELDPTDPYRGSVVGVLEDSDELKPWHINKDKKFSKQELVKLLKFNRLFFEDREKHEKMVLAFMKVSSTVNISANDSSDDRGNKERSYIKQVTTDAPTEFELYIPVFKGFPPMRFKVEICLDVEDGNARFWFESVQLHELIQTEVDSIFKKELEAAAGLVVINE